MKPAAAETTRSLGAPKMASAPEGRQGAEYLLFRRRLEWKGLQKTDIQFLSFRSTIKGDVTSAL